MGKARGPLCPRRVARESSLRRFVMTTSNRQSYFPTGQGKTMILRRQELETEDQYPTDASNPFAHSGMASRVTDQRHPLTRPRAASSDGDAPPRKAQLGRSSRVDREPCGYTPAGSRRCGRLAGHSGEIGSARTSSPNSRRHQSEADYLAALAKRDFGQGAPAALDNT